MFKAVADDLLKGAQDLTAAGDHVYRLVMREGQKPDGATRVSVAHDPQGAMVPPEFDPDGVFARPADLPAILNNIDGYSAKEYAEAIVAVDAAVRALGGTLYAAAFKLAQTADTYVKSDQPIEVM